MDRNRTDLNRDADLYRDYVAASRGTESARSAFIDRDQEEEYKARVEDKTESSFLSTMTKLAGAGLGAYAMGRTIPKDVWVEALHRMGQYGGRTFGAALQKRNQMMAGLLGGRAAKPRVRGMELTDFLREELQPFTSEIHGSMANRNARDYAETVTRDILQKRFGVADETNRRLAGLTVDDVLSMAKSNKPDTFNVISQSSIDALEKARGSHGDWFGKLGVDKRLHKSTYGRLAPGMIKDTRWASRRAVGDVLNNGLGFQIPFVGFKPIDLFSPFFRLGAKRKDFVRVGMGQKIAADVTAPKSGSSWLIDGELTHFGHRGVKALAPGRKFRSQTIDGIAGANLAKLGTHPLQRRSRRTAGAAPDTASTFFRRIGDLVGFGPQYRDEPAAVARAIHAGRLAKDIRTGKAVWKPHDNIRAQDLPFKPKLRHQKAKGYAFDPEEIITNPYSSYKGMPLAERAKARAGLSRLGEFVDADGKSTELGGWLGTRAHRPSPIDYGYTEARPDVGYRGLGRSASPYKPEKIPTGHTIFEDTLGTKLNLLSHFATTRLNQLVGFTTGIGFKPAMGKFGPLVNAARIAAIGATFNPVTGYAVEAASYVNYMFERVTNIFGVLPWSVSPADMGLKAYEGITYGAAAIKDVTGVTAAAKYTEGLLPGSVNSPLSGWARTLVPLGMGARRGGVPGMAVGLGVAALSGGVSDVFGSNVAGAGLTTSSSELAEMYSGERKVRVQSGRWWMLNRSSFYGEGTDRYAPHWLALAKSDSQYTASQYGSKSEYFKHASTLPTFHNLFRMGRDEDYFAKKHELSRPYPEAPSGAVMHAGEMLAPAPQVGPGIPQLMAAGDPTVNLATYPIGSQNDMSYKLKEFTNNASEFLGVYKFLGEAVFGGSSTGPVLANASAITDNSRRYWDKDLGGMFGMTELLRRYVVQPNDINPAEIVNTIPNQMPTFLPGQRSAFEKDRSYHKDFTVGDPYTQVKGGEHRLPGAGYEAVNKLHSGEQGRYDAVDALMILSDVAPYSEAYRYYKRKVERMKLERSWQERVQRAVRHADEVMQGFAADFTPRRFTGGVQENLDDINAEIKYSAVEQFVGAQYERLTMDVLPEAGRMVPFGTLLTHKLFPHHTPEQDYLERQVYGARFSDWQNPVAGFIRPKALTLYNENPLTATAGGALVGLTATSPVGMLARGATAGIGMGAAAAMRGGYYGQMEGGYKPAFRKNEEEVLEYFDKLEYLRYQRAINRAGLRGDNTGAQELKRQQRMNTMVGLPYGQLESVKSAVPGPERFYVDSFASAGPSQREKILQMTPRYMQDIYKSKWDPTTISRDADAVMAQFMEHNKTPGEDWEGWNLGVQKWQIQSRTSDTADNSMAIDMHRQHVSTAMIAQARMQVPNVGLDFAPSLSDESDEWHSSTVESQDLRRAAMRNGFTNVQVAPMQGRGRRNVEYRWDVQLDKREEMRERMKAIVR